METNLLIRICLCSTFVQNIKKIFKINNNIIKEVFTLFCLFVYLIYYHSKAILAMIKYRMTFFDYKKNSGGALSESKRLHRRAPQSRFFLALVCNFGCLLLRKTLLSFQLKSIFGTNIIKIRNQSFVFVLTVLIPSLGLINFHIFIKVRLA